MEPLGLEVVSVSRVPYLDRYPHGETYELDGIVLTLQRRPG